MLIKVAEEIMFLLWQEWIVFIPRHQNFHCTIDWCPNIRNVDIEYKQRMYASRLWRICQENEWGAENFLKPSIPHDETFHKAQVLESFVDWKYYPILQPHNPATLIKPLWVKWEIHISLWVVESLNIEQQEILLKVMKKSRDLYLKNKAVILDWSKIHWKQVSNN